MDMQDKEFDDVFRSKLDGLEVEPSDRVWTGIEAELEPKRRRAIWLPILQVAASVIVLVTAGILFIPRGKNANPLKHPNTGIVKVTAPVVTQESTLPSPVQPVLPKHIAAPVNRVARVNVAPKNRPVTAVQPKPVDSRATEPAQPTEQQTSVLAAAPAQAPVNTQAATLVDPVVSTPKTTTTDLIAESKPKQSGITQAPPTEIAAQPVKRHGIHNMGDLVNLVVARVDKRKDKAIQFTDTDDESSLTAVNIGPIKINKGDGGDK